MADKSHPAASPQTIRWPVAPRITLDRARSFSTLIFLFSVVFSRVRTRPGLLVVFTRSARDPMLRVHVAYVLDARRRRAVGALRELTRHICAQASYITTRRLLARLEHTAYIMSVAALFPIVVMGLRACNTVFLLVIRATGMCGPPMNLCRTEPHVCAMCRACFDSCAFKILSC